jgi:hypothetical protein
MATQPIAPTDIQARIDRLKNRSLFAEPKPTVEKKVRVHRCFSQMGGESKPNSCTCKDRITNSDALAMVARGEADWLLVSNPNTPGLRPFHRAIVVRSSKAVIEKSRRVKHQRKAEEALIQKFRKFLLRQFSKGNLPHAVLALSDQKLRAYLENPEAIREQFPEFGEHQFFEKIVELSSEFWVTRSGDKISEDTGKSISAPSGQGQLIYESSAKLEVLGGYDREAASEAGALNLLNEQVHAANFVPRKFNGGYIGRGCGPDEFESADGE